MSAALTWEDCGTACEKDPRNVCEFGGSGKVDQIADACQSLGEGVQIPIEIDGPPYVVDVRDRTSYLEIDRQCDPSSERALVIPPQARLQTIRSLQGRCLPPAVVLWMRSPNLYPGPGVEVPVPALTGYPRPPGMRG